MSDPILEALHEIRDLMRLSAKPAIDEIIVELRKLTAASDKKMLAVTLMDGTRPKAEIAKESGYDKSDVTRLVKTLDSMGILNSSSENPKLLFAVSLEVLKATTANGE